MQGNSSQQNLERRLDNWAASQSPAELSPESRKRLLGMLSDSLMPAKPIASPNGLALRFLALFAALAIVLIAMMDKSGFHLMTKSQMGGMAAIFVAAGVLFSVTLARQMIPASWPGMPIWLVLTLTGAGIIGGLGLLFPWTAPRAFISEGWPCGVMELAIATPAAFAFWLLARRGALFANASLGAALGGLAAVVALLIVQFRCMFQQAPHLLVWHGATAALAICAGVVIGALRDLEPWRPLTSIIVRLNSTVARTRAEGRASFGTKTKQK